MRFALPYSPEALARYLDARMPRTDAGRPTPIELPGHPGRWLIVGAWPHHDVTGRRSITVEAVPAELPAPGWTVRPGLVGVSLR